MEFLPKIKDFKEYLKKFSVLGQEKLLIYDTKAKKIQSVDFIVGTMKIQVFKFLLEN